MDHKTEFEKRKGALETHFDLYLFGWTDEQGNGGDYGLNYGPAEKTFTTLINTTYMFQPEPKFKLECRKYRMSLEQFEYLQDHDLDTQDFLSTLGPLPKPESVLNLANYSDAASALTGLQDVLTD